MKTFTADQFIPTRFDSAEQKAEFANQFVSFVKSDFSRGKFPKWFYNRLSMTFGHIAHYNQSGFYSTFFEDTAGKKRFIEQSLGHPCYGDPEFTYCDAEQVLIKWLKENKILEKVRQNHQEATEKYERGILASLKMKYEGA